MSDRPERNDFNPEGTRFVVVSSDTHSFLSWTAEHLYPRIYRWDPPRGYWPVAECRGMQGVDALTQARELAAWYESKYPLPDAVTTPAVSTA